MIETLAEHRRACQADGLGWRPDACRWCAALAASERRRDQRRRAQRAPALAAWELQLLARERRERADRLAREQRDAERTAAEWDDRVAAALEAAVADEVLGRPEPDFRPPAQAPERRTGRRPYLTNPPARQAA